jgi:heptosyltransferase II
MAVAAQALETRPSERFVVMRVLVIQTAFAGDLILTLPMIQVLKQTHPQGEVDVLCIPSTAGLLANHPSINHVWKYDKRGIERSIVRMVRNLQSRNYDVCISPHRSLRSALLAYGSRAQRRITFQTTTGKRLYTERVEYRTDDHEIHRNVSLLNPFGIDAKHIPAPRLYPGVKDVADVERFLHTELNNERYICVAPGSVWATKRWTAEGFSDTIRSLSAFCKVVLIGGKSDEELCKEILTRSGNAGINTAGRFGFLASAVLIQRAALLISNDSAPVHLASAMGTPVVVIYGATVPEFGFTPFGIDHEIVQVEGLSCKPCAIHGGHRCPIRTFDCMKNISPLRVVEAVNRILGNAAM